jgi:hypothetical protein
MREHLTQAIFLTRAELVRLFMLSNALVTVTVLLETIEFLVFLPEVY